MAHCSEKVYGSQHLGPEFEEQLRDLRGRDRTLCDRNFVLTRLTRLPSTRLATATTTFDSSTFIQSS